MTFKQELKQLSTAQVWEKYCGFLDISVEQFMQIQLRLLQEQLTLYSQCELGRRIMGDTIPATVTEFRKNVPLTTYDDYADVLLPKKESMLPAPPVVWLETTWESGNRPVKVAPYTEEMLTVSKNNLLATLILVSSTERGKFRITSGQRALYGLAPLPYATGLFPLLFASEIDLQFLPSIREARTMSFSEQNRVGFRQSFERGMTLFFGMSSIIYAITKNFSISGSFDGKKQKRMLIRPSMLWRILSAKYRSHRDGTPVRPADLFRLNGFVCVGTDTALFKDELERAWGCRPLEISGGTEPTCIATETWSKNGLVFFPDACFYEFIPENEMLRSFDEPGYTPRTFLMDELVANENYELVVTVLKGGAFMRYRVGDMYRCIRLRNEQDGLNLPQFEYIDRVPTVIDIAGFTRITERAVNKVIEVSRLPIVDWFARKQYDDEKRSFMHMYVEIAESAEGYAFTNQQIIRDHLSIYFRHYDHDYNDLKHLLGIEPLQITLLTRGTIDSFRKEYGRPIRKINPPQQDIINLLYLQNGEAGRGGEGFCR